MKKCRTLSRTQYRTTNTLKTKNNRILKKVYQLLSNRIKLRTKKIMAKTMVKRHFKNSLR